LKCRVLREEDFEDAADFLANEPFPGSRDGWLRRFNHWWIQNPVFNESFIRGWVLENEKKEIVGFIGNIPQSFKLGENNVLANISTSWCVKKEYRHHSLKLFQAFLSQNKTSLCISTTVAKQLHSMHFRWGYKQIPLHSFNHVLFWILNPKDCLKYAFMYKGYSAIVSNLAGWLGFLPLGIVNQVRCKWKIIKNTELQIEEVTKCGSAFDELWKRISKHHSAISVRTADILNWHYNFMKKSTIKYHMLACTECGSIPGYAVYQVIENPRFHSRRLRIVDLFVEYKREDVVLALLNSVINAGCRLNAVAVEITGGIEWICQTLSSTRPFVRKNPTVPPFYCASDAMVSKKLEDTNVWYATEYDGDSSL